MSEHDANVDSSVGSLVEEVKIELNDIDDSDVSEHAQRFEALHGKLQEALTTIDGL